MGQNPSYGPRCTGFWLKFTKRELVQRKELEFLVIVLDGLRKIEEQREKDV
jgi:hypothetical protein